MQVCTLSAIEFSRRCDVAVCLYGRDSKADGTVRLLHHGTDRTQAADRYNAAGHQPVLLQVLHVQSGACPLHQREFLSVTNTMLLCPQTRRDMFFCEVACLFDK